MRTLHQAALDGNKQELENLLKQADYVDMRDKGDRTPLHWAAINENSMIVKFLLDKGAQVNAQANDGYTPLHWALGRGNIQVVQVLLNAGADVNLRGTEGTTPLHVAAGSGGDWAREKTGGETTGVEMVKLLLDKGADVNAKDEVGRTPIYEAIQFANIKIMELLLNEGVDVSIRDKNLNLAPLHMAVLCGPRYGSGGAIPREIRIEVGKAMTNLLLDCGADVNVQDYQGRTPLDKADYDEIAKLIKNRGGTEGSSKG